MSQVAGMNPWLTMWSQPRSTIRALIHNRPTYRIYFLSAIFALQSFFFYLNWWSLGYSSSTYLLLTLGVVFSPLIGLVWLYFTSFVFYLTGRLLKGEAPALHLRTALAWSRVPTTLTLLMWLILIFTDPETVFIQDAATGPSSIFVNLITFILGLWSLVLLIQSLREIQHFSILRSILNILLAWLICTFAFVFLFGVIRYIYLHY